ncbi:hypothetical protein [Nocardia tenerifensis]|uniref:hypothetical protein n=1 Tax=Nocardia tenerifensis TaxID=228006 RepID=UPI0011B591EF|nr:hypothetical protein [Nocardia tenerifensis]
MRSHPHTRLIGQREPSSPTGRRRARPMSSAATEGAGGVGRARDARPAGADAGGQGAESALDPFAFVLS